MTDDKTPGEITLGKELIACRQANSQLAAEVARVSENNEMLKREIHKRDEAMYAGMRCIEILQGNVQPHLADRALKGFANLIEEKFSEASPFFAKAYKDRQPHPEFVQAFMRSIGANS